MLDAFQMGEASRIQAKVHVLCLVPVDDKYRELAGFLAGGGGDIEVRHGAVGGVLIVRAFHRGGQRVSGCVERSVAEGIERGLTPHRSSRGGHDRGDRVHQE